MGKLIVVEGLDGSGKATQTQNLADYFSQQQIPYRAVTFPDYNSPSSTLVKMYLGGEIGDVDEVGAYAATSFYASDRYISYKTRWEADYLAGTTILADRYTTSNAIYQMAKLPQEEWEDFLAWTWDYEFSRLGLPEPTQVLYLEVELFVSQALLEKRYHGDKNKRDIHEKNLAYLELCRKAASYACSKFGWQRIVCTDGEKMLPENVIFQKIVEAL